MVVMKVDLMGDLRVALMAASKVVLKAVTKVASTVCLRVVQWAEMSAGVKVVLYLLRI